jgi:mannose-6-phosphate isomerase-like protein (cupin superfamily)
VRATSSAESTYTIHDGDLQLWFVLSGESSLLRPGHAAERLAPGDSVAVPAGMPHALCVDGAACEFLEVTVPAGADV